MESESLASSALAGGFFANVPPGHRMPPVGWAQLKAKNKGDLVHTGQPSVWDRGTGDLDELIEAAQHSLPSSEQPAGVIF